MLLDARLVTQAEADAPPADARAGDGTRLFTLRGGEALNNRLGGCVELRKELGSCGWDYVNFRCEDAGELAAMLRQRIELPEDVDPDDVLEEECDADDGPTLATLLRSGLLTNADYLSSGSFFSFCQGCVLDRDHDSHCDRCHDCSDWHYWHCFACDRCTYGQTIPRCEHCGAEHGGLPGYARRRRRRHIALSVDMNNIQDAFGAEFEPEEEDEAEEDATAAAAAAPGDASAPGASDSDEEVVEWPPEQTGGCFAVAVPLPADEADTAFDDAARAAAPPRIPEEAATQSCTLM